MLKENGKITVDTNAVIAYRAGVTEKPEQQKYTGYRERMKNNVTRNNKGNNVTLTPGKTPTHRGNIENAARGR